MPPLTLVQKRALLAAANNVHKGEKAYMKANREYSAVPSWLHWLLLDAAERKIDVARAKWRKARDLLNRLEAKLGVNGRTINYHLVSKNAIANVLKKHKLAGPLITRAQEAAWHKGLEAEMERARANFNNFKKGVFHQKINLIGESHRKKTPSPPKRVSPRRASPPPANNAHRRVHGIGPANNTRITWSRNANGKILIYQTLSKLQLRLTNAQRNALSKMSENQAMNTIRQLARQR
jgi:hypothetical protein